jgi:hypothetical protein
MSVARHLHTSPHPRTEVEVAADAIVAILDARIVPRTPGMIGRLSMATGVPVAMIKKAWELKQSGHRPPVPTRRPVVDATAEATRSGEPAAPKPQYKPGYHPNSRARNEAPRAEKEPVPGKRICSGKCGQLKNLDEFAVKNKRTGQRSAWCKECIPGVSEGPVPLIAEAGEARAGAEVHSRGRRRARRADLRGLPQTVPDR